MARGGINKAVVKIARNKLIARGNKPTIDAVRVELGNTGSKTTIQRYLKELAEHEPSTPPALSEEISILICQISERIREEAEYAVANEREDLTRRQLEYRAEQKLSQERIRHLEEMNENLATQLQALLLGEESLKEQMQKIEAERDRLACIESSLRAISSERENQIQSLEEKNRHSRDVLAHYRESVERQRTEDIRKNEGEYQQFHLQIRQLQQANYSLHAQIEQLSRDNERLLLEARQNSKELRIKEGEIDKAKNEKQELVRLNEKETNQLKQTIQKNTAEKAMYLERIKKLSTKYRTILRINK
ncbi:DNA-binding protein [Pseudomonas sp. W03]|uniref:DNA-binding protein n=1 Tax=Pseudomonas sp. W03 TaxID=3090666 RepID=UPI003A4D8340